MHVTSKSGRVFDLPSPEEEARIRKGISADPDTRELSEEEMVQLRPLGRLKVAVTKQPISIRLSPEVLEYFKATGPGWQTRIDQVLREYVESR
ncbi:BrnA antitoxin family protein [uncultured Thiocystis sp.]|jgi:uncharacterized protein (DUF4415 family)|uniref:BrnA antitoxin family protein n=1 Tax=uncultured Thiocystis sp. TaxID=1202134 RepID=UPI0025E5EBA1|nr:BrnA antitoxin family protein [uncultured Thiocystis sp.]